MSDTIIKLIIVVSLVLGAIFSVRIQNWANEENRKRIIEQECPLSVEVNKSE